MVISAAPTKAILAASALIEPKLIVAGTTHASSSSEPRVAPEPGIHVSPVTESVSGSPSHAIFRYTSTETRRATKTSAAFVVM